MALNVPVAVPGGYVATTTVCVERRLVAFGAVVKTMFNRPAKTPRLEILMGLLTSPYDNSDWPVITRPENVTFLTSKSDNVELVDSVSWPK